MSYQIALHSDTDNLHYHFSFVEKKPNFKYNNKIDYRREFKIEKKDMNFTEELFVQAHNKFLVGMLGNFVNRNLSFIIYNFNNNVN